MAKLKVNSIVNKSDDGAPELTYGATIPSGQVLNVNGNLNISGVVTATNFSGDGSQLTQLSIATESKAIAFKLILDPLTFKS